MDGLSEENILNGTLPVPHKPLSLPSQQITTNLQIAGARKQTAHQVPALQQHPSLEITCTDALEIASLNRRTQL